jgi:hypothetical protein
VQQPKGPRLRKFQKQHACQTFIPADAAVRVQGNRPW